MSPVHITNGRVYTEGGKTWPAVSDVAHYETQVQDEIDFVNAGNGHPDVLATLSRAGWDGVLPIGPTAISELSKHFDSNGSGSSFAGTIRAVNEARLRGDGGGGEPTGQTATPDAVKQAEEFGRANVRQDIGNRIQLWQQRQKKTAEALVAEIASYCATGHWPAGGGSGTTGSEGIGTGVGGGVVKP